MNSYNQLDSFLQSNQIVSYLTQTTLTHLGQIKIFILVVITVVGFVNGRLHRDQSLQIKLQKLNDSAKFISKANKDYTDTKVLVNKIDRALKMFSIVWVITIVVYISTIMKYLNLSFRLEYPIMFITLCSILIYLLKRYNHSKSLQYGLVVQNIQKQEQNDIKYVLSQFGEQLSLRLKQKLLEMIRSEKHSVQNEECRLFKCKQQLSNLTEGIKICQQTIVKISECKWCYFCSNQTEAKKVVQPKTQFDPKNIKSNASLTLDQKKVLINGCLEYYQNKTEYLSNYCKDQCTRHFYSHLRPIVERYNQQIKEIVKKI